MMTARTWTALAISGLALAGCGFKGPLTLPPKPGDVVVRPGPTDTKPTAPAEKTQPAPPQPTPETPSPSPPDKKDATTGG